MDHGPHGGDSSMEPMCSMSMLFTWDTTDLCIIFRSWHIYTNVQLVVSLLAVAALTAGYEAVREMSRRYEASSGLDLGHRAHAENSVSSVPVSDQILVEPLSESSSLLKTSGRGVTQSDRKRKVIKGAFYGVQVFYSFFIMLLFMTYNGWVMLAVGVGAFAGYLVFGSDQTSASKTAACH